MCSESARTHGRGCELVHCARPVDNTARSDRDVMAVEPSVPPGRPRQQNDAALLEAVRAHWREVVLRARPVDSTARIDVDVHKTARLDLDVDKTGRIDPRRAAVKPSVPPPPRQQSVVRGARSAGNTARLRRAVVKPFVPPPPPIQQNPAALRAAVTVGEANLWGLRVKRTAVAFAAVLLFVALVVFSGQPFGGDDQPAPQPSVPSASGDGSSAATEQEQPGAVSPPGAHPEGSSGGALPPAQGVQAFSGGAEPRVQPSRAEQSENSAVVAAAPPQRRAGGPVARVVHGLRHHPVVDAACVAQSGRVGSNGFSASSSWCALVVLIAVTGSPRTGSPRGHDRRAGSARPPQVRGDRDHRS